jgi:putative ABC transport system permease protein
LRGVLEVSDTAFGQTLKTHDVPAPGEVWVDARLLPVMDLALGESLYVGEKALTITRFLVNEPDRGGGFGVGLRVMMNIADIEATQIIQPGSRVSFRYLFGGNKAALDGFKQSIEDDLPATHRWRDLSEAQPSMARSLDRSEQFLLLAGVLGVGLAGVAIALAARRYSERHYDYVAMMKALGTSSARVLMLYGGNLLWLALLAVLLGCSIGFALQSAVFYLLQGSVDISTDASYSMKPFFLGVGTALICLFAFALPPLLRLQRVSPMRVLRKDLDASGVSETAGLLAGVGGIALLMFWYSGNLTLTLALLLGAVLIFVVAAVLATLLLRGSASLGMQAGGRWRLALASLRRRGRANTVQAVLFSLSIMLLLIIVLVRTALLEEWRLQLPPDTPNHFLINIADDERESVERLLQERGLKPTPATPMLVGRLLAVNDELIAERVKRLSLHRSFDRDWRMSWSETLPEANTILEGQWWAPGSDVAEVSLEQEMAEHLQVGLGDTLRFAIGSEQFDVTISSIRELDWQSMKPNFFSVFSPAALRDLPATYLSSFYLPAEEKPFLNTFLRQHPTITVIELDAVMQQVRAIIDQVGAAVELVLVLIVLSGALVLIASVQSSLDERLRESAILRTLGASRALVLGSLAIEFAVLGALAGLLAAGAAEVSVYALQENMINLQWRPHYWVWALGPVLGAVMIGLLGYLACRRVASTPPVRVLREL